MKRTNKTLMVIHASAAFICMMLISGMQLHASTETVGRTDKNVPNSSPESQAQDWKKVINDCIAKVKNSDATFYQREKKATGTDVAKQMKKDLQQILKNELVPQPFSRNAGITLGMICMFEGIYREGLTDSPAPYLIEVGGNRVKVYDWLKTELQIKMLPGEEEGHDIVGKQYIAEIKPDLLVQWSKYFDRCIQVVRESKDVVFIINGKERPATNFALIMEQNKTNALNSIINNELDYSDNPESRIMIELTYVPISSIDQSASNFNLGRASIQQVLETNNTKKHLIAWIESKAGNQPPIPKWKKVK